MHSIYNLKYSMPKKNSIVFHNRSNFDNHFIIKQLAKVFEKQFTCLGENTEKKQLLQFQKEITRIEKVKKKLQKNIY